MYAISRSRLASSFVVGILVSGQGHYTHARAGATVSRTIYLDICKLCNAVLRSLFVTAPSPMRLQMLALVVQAAYVGHLGSTCMPSNINLRSFQFVLHMLNILCMYIYGREHVCFAVQIKL